MFADKLFGPVRQWGYLVKDLDEAMQAWVTQLGVGPFWGFRNVALSSHFDNVDSEIVIDVGLAYQNGVQIELIQQQDPSQASPYADFYQSDAKQCFQQVAYFCQDIDAAVAMAKSNGMRQRGYVESAMQSRYYYFDAPALDGMLIELMEVDADMIAAFEACAQQADDWDGSDPYRLITF